MSAVGDERQAVIDLALYDLDRDNCLVRLRTRGGGFYWQLLSPRLKHAERRGGQSAIFLIRAALFAIANLMILLSQESFLMMIAVFTVAAAARRAHRPLEATSLDRQEVPGRVSREAPPADPGGAQALMGALKLRGIAFAESWATRTAQFDDPRGLR
ncbi:hypothetical protein [Nocardia sp. NPDC005745]|uniref:hypothetical protein n=1 Tax=Nocardia sp. NPDC005745 TaxID=3157061 RepID=UPI0033EB1A1D